LTTLQLSIICITALSLALIAAATLAVIRDAGPAKSKAPPRIGHRVTVHTKQPDDQTLFGVLVGDYADRVVLEDAEYVNNLGATPIPGRQHIAMRNIAWIDVHALVAPVPETAPAQSPTEA
jgi:hypothetical protein